MRDTQARRSVAIRGLPIFLAILFMVAAACRRDQALPGPSGDAQAPSHSAVTAAPPVDLRLDNGFAFAAGLPADSPSFAAWQEEPAWRDYAAAAGKAWEEFDNAVLGPIRSWATDDLGAVRARTTTLFYPFGGPDFATAFALFPDARATVLLGLEPAGDLPDFGRIQAEGRAAFYADLEALTLDFLTRGYFITKQMMETFSRGNVHGALPVIGFFLKRGGCSIIDVRHLTPNAAGGWLETSHQRTTMRVRRPYGVRIDYLKPGDAAFRSVYYFSCDVEDMAFKEGSPLHRFFQGFERMATFVKAGSYLLHWNNFSTLRRLILDRSLFVLQDDTGIPYRVLKGLGWDIRLFGRYATPVKDFTNVEQEDLRQAYEGPETSAEPLPIRFGYRWVTRVDNLLLAERPRRPYKVPVMK